MEGRQNVLQPLGFNAHGVRSGGTRGYRVLEGVRAVAVCVARAGTPSRGGGILVYVANRANVATEAGVAVVRCRTGQSERDVFDGGVAYGYWFAAGVLKRERDCWFLAR